MMAKLIQMFMSKRHADRKMLREMKNKSFINNGLSETAGTGGKADRRYPASICGGIHVMLREMERGFSR